MVEDDLKLLILLSWPPKYWDYVCVLPCLLDYMLEFDWGLCVFKASTVPTELHPYTRCRVLKQASHMLFISTDLQRSLPQDKFLLKPSLIAAFSNLSLLASWLHHLQSSAQCTEGSLSLLLASFPFCAIWPSPPLHWQGISPLASLPLSWVFLCLLLFLSPLLSIFQRKTPKPTKQTKPGDGGLYFLSPPAHTMVQQRGWSSNHRMGSALGLSVEKAKLWSNESSNSSEHTWGFSGWTLPLEDRRCHRTGVGL